MKVRSAYGANENEFTSLANLGATQPWPNWYWFGLNPRNRCTSRIASD